MVHNRKTSGTYDWISEMKGNIWLGKPAQTKEKKSLQLLVKNCSALRPGGINRRGKDSLLKAPVKRRTSHELNPIQPIWLTWSPAFDAIKLNWFYLEQVRFSLSLASRELRLKTDFGSNIDLFMSRTKRIIKGLKESLWIYLEEKLTKKTAFVICLV